MSIPRSASIDAACPSEFQSKVMYAHRDYTPQRIVCLTKAGMMLGGLLNPPKEPTVEGLRLNDLSVQTSTCGAVIPRVYGMITVDGNVFWLENSSIKEIYYGTHTQSPDARS
jgi:hypothetical protein